MVNPDLASPEQDMQYKQFVSQVGHASIYIYRPDLWEGHVKSPIKLNDRSIGATTAKTFLYQSVPAGDYSISAQADNTAVLNLRVEAGKIYYVYQDIKFSNSQAKTRLSLVDDNQGQSGVLVSSLVVPKSVVELKSKQTETVVEMPSQNNKSDKLNFVLSHANFHRLLKEQLENIQKQQQNQLNQFVDQQLQLRQLSRSQLSADKQQHIDALVNQYSQIESIDRLTQLHRSQILPALSDAGLDEFTHQVVAGDVVLQRSAYFKTSQDALSQRALAAFGQFVSEILPVFADFPNQK